MTPHDTHHMTHTTWHTPHDTARQDLNQIGVFWQEEVRVRWHASYASATAAGMTHSVATMWPPSAAQVNFSIWARGTRAKPRLHWALPFLSNHTEFPPRPEFHLCTCAYVSVSARVYVCVCARVYVCVCARVFVCVYISFLGFRIFGGDAYMFIRVAIHT